MGTRNYPWNFILSAFLCTMMALEGRDATAASPESHVNVSWSTNNNINRTGPGANRNDSMAEPNTQTAHSLLGTSLSPFMMMMVDGEGRMSTSLTTPAWEGSTSGEPAEGSAFPTTGTTHGMGTESATTSSPPLSTATTSSSSSSSSSPKGSPAVTPSPEQSSTSSTTETPSATTSHPPTALVLSSHSVSAQFSAGTATTQSPTTPRPVAATSVTSPASDTTEARLSPTPGSSTETRPAQPSSTPPTQGQPTVEVTATSSPSSPTGSPSPSTATASVGSSATIPDGEWESSTMNEGSGTTTDPSVGTSHSLPPTSLLSLSTTGMVRTGTTPGWGGSSLGTSPGSGAVSSALPTTGTGTTIPSMDTGSGTDSSLSFSSATTSHSSSSSSPGVSPAVTPSLEQSSTSSTTGMLFTTASHPSTALALSTAGVTGTESDTVPAEEVTPSPAPSTASTNPGASASITSPASGTTESSRSPTLGSSTETPRHTSTPPTQGQPTVEVTPTSPPTGSPSPSTATIPPGEGKGSTTNQGSRTTAEPIAKTSHSPPSTSLATPSTTNLSVSTSVNPSFTGACLSVSVSIEVQNVTGREIHLSWTSGSKGSLYIISVKDGKETNKTATEDTKAVLKNLLPGHVYNISVAESSCAENNQASVTVRTDPDSCFERTEFCLAESTGCSDLRGIACSNNQAFFCSVLFKSQTFNNTLYNSRSEGYKTLSERIKTDIVEGMRAELGNDHFDILMLGFRSGSVVADFLSLLPKEEAVDVDDIRTHLSTVLRNKFGDQTEATVQPLSAQSPTDNSSSWRVAVIVLGVLLGVALVLILLAILFYIYARRRSGIYFE